MRLSRPAIAAFLVLMALVILVTLLFNGPIIGVPSEGLGPSPDLR
jgi:hypothetical protein